MANRAQRRAAEKAVRRARVRVQRPTDRHQRPRKRADGGSVLQKVSAYEAGAYLRWCAEQGIEIGIDDVAELAEQLRRCPDCLGCGVELGAQTLPYMPGPCPTCRGHRYLRADGSLIDEGEAAWR